MTFALWYAAQMVSSEKPSPKRNWDLVSAVLNSLTEAQRDIVAVNLGYSPRPKNVTIH